MAGFADAKEAASVLYMKEFISPRLHERIKDAMDSARELRTTWEPAVVRAARAVLACEHESSREGVCDSFSVWAGRSVGGPFRVTPSSLQAELGASHRSMVVQGAPPSSPPGSDDDDWEAVGAANDMVDAVEVASPRQLLDCAKLSFADFVKVQMQVAPSLAYPLPPQMISRRCYAECDQ